VRHPLTDTYRDERRQLLALGHTLSPRDAAAVTQACPAWSIKDVYAHLAGIASDILAGNTEGAATEAWADAHVAARAGASLAEVLDEWQRAGDEVSEVMEVAGEAFPFQLFVDQWTHGWDIRAAIGPEAAATPDMSVYEHYLHEFFRVTSADLDADVPRLTVRIGNEVCELGNGSPCGELELSLFEYARITMGRRSAKQLGALAWPPSVRDPSGYMNALVFWSINDSDVDDPVI